MAEEQQKLEEEKERERYNLYMIDIKVDNNKHIKMSVAEQLMVQIKNQIVNLYGFDLVGLIALKIWNYNVSLSLSI